MVVQHRAAGRKAVQPARNEIVARYLSATHPHERSIEHCGEGLRQRSAGRTWHGRDGERRYSALLCQVLKPAQFERGALVLGEDQVAAARWQCAGSIEMVSSLFRFADMGVEPAQMILQGFAPVALALDEPGFQSDLVDDRLIAGAIAALPLGLQDLGNDLSDVGAVSIVDQMRRRESKFEHRLSLLLFDGE